MSRGSWSAEWEKQPAEVLIPESDSESADESNNLGVSDDANVAAAGLGSSSDEAELGASDQEVVRGVSGNEAPDGG